MKNWIWLLLFNFLVLIAQGQDTLRIQPDAAVSDQHLQEINIRELPEIIKQKLSSQQYSSWILQAAFREQRGSNIGADPADSSNYIVELRKDDATIRVRFNNVGNRKAFGESEN